MIDLQTAVNNAVFAALNGAGPVIALADVYGFAPEDTQPGTKGVVILGMVALENEPDGGSGLCQATVEVHTFVRKPDATVLYALNSAVRNALEGQDIAATGALLSPPVFKSADPSTMADGKTLQDTLRFETFVQAA